MRKITLFLNMVLMLLFFQAHAGIKQDLKTTAKELFKIYCPKQCMNVDVKVNSKTSVSRSISEPGFEELGGGTKRSTKVTGVSVHILADKTLSKKTRDFINATLLYEATAYDAPVKIKYTEVIMPKPAGTPPFQYKSEWASTLLILAGLLGLFFIGFAIFRKSKAKNKPVQLQNERPTEALPHSDHAPVASVARVTAATNLQDASLAILVSENIEATKKILGRWAVTPDGFPKAIQIIFQLPPTLRDELKGVVGEKSKHELRSEFIQSANIGKEELRSIVLELKREIDFESLITTAQVKDEDDFHFLKSFDAIKLIHLIREEDPINKALILMQLDLDRRSDVFNALPTAEQKQVALELGRLTTLHWKQLKSLSRRLADRAAQMINLDLREANGFDALVNLVEHGKNPEAFVSDIKQADITLGSRLGNSVTSLEMIEWFEDDELSLFLSNFTRDDLVALLVGRLSPFKDLIVSKLSKQMVEYVNFNLDPEYQKKIPAKTLKTAEDKAYTVLKQMFNTAQLDFKEVSQRRAIWEDPKLYSDDTKGTKDAKGKRINV